MRKKILVTGGLGFIGSHTVVELYNSGFEPIIIDNLSNSELFILDRISDIINVKPILHQADVADEKAMLQIFETYDHIYGAIHFAAYKSVNESVSKPIAYYSNNIDSTLVLLKLCLKHGVESLVFSSSCTVYGQPNQLPVTEATPYGDIRTPYGMTKRMCEEIIRDTVTIQDKLKAVSLRYFNPVGAHPSAKIGELPKGVPGNLVPFITQTAAGIRKELTIFGSDYNTPDGTCIRDFIHVVDLAQAHVKAIEYLLKPDAEVYQALNIGTGQGTSVMQLVKAFLEIPGVALPYKMAGRREGDVEQIYADTNKAEKVLNWKANLSMKQALIDAWNWQNTLA